jgi:hypothetical protein
MIVLVMKIIFILERQLSADEHRGCETHLFSVFVGTGRAKAALGGHPSEIDCYGVFQPNVGNAFRANF